MAANSVRKQQSTLREAIQGVGGIRAAPAKELAGTGSQDRRFPDFLSHNRWLRETGSTEPPLDVVDTTDPSARGDSEAIAAWIRERL